VVLLNLHPPPAKKTHKKANKFRAKEKELDMAEVLMGLGWSKRPIPTIKLLVTYSFFFSFKAHVLFRFSISFSLRK
jgi:hypothetical protein